MSTALLLVNYGGPRSVEEVPAFLKDMTGREAAEHMLQAVTARYRAIGGGSPLAGITEQLARLLEARLAPAVKVRAAFCYSSPSIQERIGECRDAGIDRILCLAMSPFYSSKTVGAYVDAIQNHLSRLEYRPAVQFIHSWCREPAFLDAWIKKVREEMPKDESFYLFSAHSLPQSLVSEPYKLQMEETADAVAAAVGLDSHHYSLVWQSVPKGTEEPWIGPSPEEVMNGLGGRFSRIVEVPIGFVSDHLETLYDMDIDHRQHAEAKGLLFSRISSLNSYPPFVEALEIIVKKGLSRAMQ